MPPVDPRALAVDLDRAQAIIDDAGSSTVELENAGRFEQLATRAVASAPRAAQRALMPQLAGATASTMRADLLAAGALARLAVPRVSLPHWRIVSPPPPATLLRYFRAAQSRFGVGWQYLAAIEFIETKFGRVHGLSTAGAEGPMQFMPATWKRYGYGDVHNPRDAIFGAARYLVASGGLRPPDASRSSRLLRLLLLAGHLRQARRGRDPPGRLPKITAGTAPCADR
jgi:hypothetical protein